MRKGMNTLSGLIHDKMESYVRNGDVFIFINGKKTTMKLLHAEIGGLVLYQKRLKHGTFRMHSSAASKILLVFFVNPVCTIPFLYISPRILIAFTSYDVAASFNQYIDFLISLGP